jgi:hypothetical protein
MCDLQGFLVGGAGIEPATLGLKAAQPAGLYETNRDWRTDFGGSWLSHIGLSLPTMFPSCCLCRPLISSLDRAGSQGVVSIRGRIDAAGRSLSADRRAWWRDGSGGLIRGG